VPEAGNLPYDVEAGNLPYDVDLVAKGLAGAANPLPNPVLGTAPGATPGAIPAHLAAMAFKVLVAFFTIWLTGTTLRALETSPVSSAPDTAPSLVELDPVFSASTTLLMWDLILP
jgi:hypothetical protein